MLQTLWLLMCLSIKRLACWRTNIILWLLPALSFKPSVDDCPGMIVHEFVLFYVHTAHLRYNVLLVRSV